MFFVPIEKNNIKNGYFGPESWAVKQKAVFL